MAEGTVTLTTFVVPKAKLAALSKEARGLIFMLGHIANELMTLNRLLQFASNYEDHKTPVGHAQVSQAMLLTRLLAGKEWEAWNFIRAIFLASPSGKTYVPLLTREASEALEQLKRYFGRKNLIDLVRNDFAFHYLAGDWAERLSASFDKIEEGECEFYLSDTRLNSHWWGAEVVVNYTLLESIQMDKPAEAMDQLMDDAIKLFSLLSTFCDHAIPIILCHHLNGYLGDEKGRLVVTNVPDPRRIGLPVVVRDKGVDEGQETASKSN